MTWHDLGNEKLTSKKNIMSKKIKNQKSKNGLAVLIFFIVSILIIPNIYYGTISDKCLEPRLLALSIFMFFVIIFTIFGKRNKFRVFDYRILKNPLVIIYFLYLIITGISSLTAINKFEAIYEFLKLFTFFIFFLYLILFILPHQKSKIFLIKTVIVLSLIISFIGVVQFISLLSETDFGIKSVYTVTGNSAHKNLYSQLLFLTFSFSVYGLYYFKDIWKKLSFIAALASILLIIVLMTRSVWLALFVSTVFSVVVFIFSDLKKIINKKIKPVIISIGVVIGIALAVFIIINIVDTKKNIKHHLEEATDFSSGNTYHRLHLWNKTLSLIKESPFLGVGAGNWKINIAKKGTSISDKDNWKNAVRPHSDYLWVLSETGIIGFLSYFSLFVLSLFFVLKCIQKTKETENKVLMLIFFFTVTGYAVYSFFSFPKERIEHQIFINIIFAFIVFEFDKLFSNKKDTKQKKTKKIPIKLISIFVFILLLSVSYSSYKRIKAEIGFNEIFELQKKDRYNDIISLIDDFYSPVTTLEFAANPVLFYKGLALDRTKVPNIEVINLFKKALEDHPYNMRTLNGLIYIHSKDKNYKEAERYCKEALLYTPGDARTVLKYAKIKERIYGKDSAYAEIIKVKRKNSIKGIKKYIKFLLRNKINTLIEKTDNKKLKNKLFKNGNNDKFLKEIYKETQNKNENFEKIFLKRIITKMKKQKDVLNDSSVQRLIKDYQIELPILSKN